MQTVHKGSEALVDVVNVGTALKGRTAELCGRQGPHMYWLPHDRDTRESAAQSLDHRSHPLPVVLQFAPCISPAAIGDKVTQAQVSPSLPEMELVLRSRLAELPSEADRGLCVPMHCCQR